MYLHGVERHGFVSTYVTNFYSLPVIGDNGIHSIKDDSFINRKTNESSPAEKRPPSGWD
jgi:hypothetical protein